MKKQNFISLFLLAIFFNYVLLFNIPSPLYAQEEKFDSIELLPPQLNRGKLLMEALKNRKSTRSFDSKDLPLDVLSNLLWAASGMNRSAEKLLTAPSAHNWQEIKIYVAMKTGLYLYEPIKHILIPVLHKDIRKHTGNQSITSDAPVNFIYVANFKKMKSDPESQHFYSATDTGFISQNVYLFCASEGLATVILGGIDREKLSQEMNLEDSQKIILSQPIGYSLTNP